MYSHQSSYDEVMSSKHRDSEGARPRLKNCREVLNDLVSGVVSQSPNPSILSIDENYFAEASSPQVKSKKERKTINGSMRFVGKLEWKDEKECFVCERVFDKIRGVQPHHCRACGHGVCGDCSNSKVNDRRVCDLCYIRQENQASEHMKLELLHMKEHKIKVAQEQLKVATLENNKAKEDTANFEKKLKEIEKDRTEKLRRLEQEKLQFEEGIDALRDRNVRLKEHIRDNYSTIETKEAKLKGIKMQLAVLKLELNQKRAVVEKKQAELKALELRRDLKDASKDSIVVGIDHGGSRTSSRNFSLLGSVKEGKYNLSTNPYQI